MEKSVTIVCSECAKNIQMTAKDAEIKHVFNGGMPYLDITVECPHCNKKSEVRKTPATHDLLADRIARKDYNSGGGVMIREKPDGSVETKHFNFAAR